MASEKKLAVLKNFNTKTRRFKVGDFVIEGEDISPFTVNGLQSKGFLQKEKAAEDKPKAAPAVKG